MDDRGQLLSPGLGSHGEETQGSAGSGLLAETATVAGRSGQTWSHRKAWMWLEDATRKREGPHNLALPGHLPTKPIYPGFSIRRARELGDGVPVR